MSAYSYSEARVDKLVEDYRRIRIGALVAGAVLLVTAIYVATIRVSHPGRRVWEVLSIILFVLACQLFQNNWNFRKKEQVLRKGLTQASVVVTAGEVRVHYSGGLERRFERESIVRMEEATLGGGLYLRTANRYRWGVVPKSLDDFEEIKRELAQSGIPLTKKVVPTNLEEFAMVLILCCNVMCVLFTHDVRMLSVNFGVAALMGPCGYVVIRANRDFPMRKAILGLLIFIAVPAAALAWALWGHR